MDYGVGIKTRRLVNSKIEWINDVQEVENVENFEYNLPSILNKEETDKSSLLLF